MAGRSMLAWGTHSGLMLEEKQRITPDAIEAEENAELRRVMLEILKSTAMSGPRSTSRIRHGIHVSRTAPNQIEHPDEKRNPYRSGQ